MQLNPDQARQRVGPDQGSNCLHRVPISANDSSRLTVNMLLLKARY